MEAELRCPDCKDFFEDPVMLQCTHHICAKHVGPLTLGGGVPCPVCCSRTQLPASGALRVDTALRLIVAAWKEQREASSGTATLRCGFCEDRPASRRCVQCDGVFCEECEKTYHSKDFFKSHVIVDLTGKDGKASGGVDAYTGRMRCDEHSGEKLSFYCLDCRMPVCSHCLILGEHKGHHQNLIAEASTTGRDTLSAWVKEISKRSGEAGDLLERLRTTEAEVERNADSQRNIIMSELDHLKSYIDTKRNQLLSRSGLEEQKKAQELQQLIDREEAAQGRSSGLVSRSEDVLALTSEHAFLAVLLPLIQDMKIASQPRSDLPPVSCDFRPLSTDAQKRSIEHLDLGHLAPAALPPQPQAVGVSSMVSSQYASGVGVVQQAQVAVAWDGSIGSMQPQQNYSVLPQSYSSAAHATYANLRQQSVAGAAQQHGAAGVAPSVYVYRSG